MQTKLQELTDKIYQEGVERGTREAEEIINKAKTDAEATLKKASVEAEKIIADARQKANELQTNIQAELKLTVKQALNTLKQQITNLIVAQAVQADVKDVLKNTDFLQEIVLTAVQNWNPSADSNIDLAVLLPAGKEKELQQYFNSKAKVLLNKGLKINFSDRIKNGFEIGPSDGSYKISFTDDDFAHFFSEFMRPKIASILFEGDR